LIKDISLLLITTVQFNDARELCSMISWQRGKGMIVPRRNYTGHLTEIRTTRSVTNVKQVTIG